MGRKQRRKAGEDVELDSIPSSEAYQLERVDRQNGMKSRSAVLLRPGPNPTLRLRAFA